ncbi:unnamed protein product [Periconia digitata]|uniref:Ankyrin repeat protein n=1 Tax=Periconia digitata TaxID=1303443 RepID=A0A9W4UDF0_9PLEO|nr:unnamed protein product [Periconia digitata]
MDPLTALGVGANVIQVVDCSIKIISQTHQIYKAADGMADDLRDVEKLATDLSNHNALLLADLRRIDPEQHSSSVLLQYGGGSSSNSNSSNNATTTLVPQATPPTRSIQLENANANDQALADLCQDCNCIANTLLFKLEKVRYKPGLTSRKNEWKAAGKAIRSAWEQKEIEAIHSRLRQYRAQLDSRQLLSVRELITRSAQQQDGRLEVLDGQTRKIIAGLMQSRDEATADASVLKMTLSKLSQLVIAENEKTRNLFPIIRHASPLDIVVAQPYDDDPTVSISRANSPVPTMSISEAAVSGNIEQLRKLLKNPRQHIDPVDEELSALQLACLNQQWKAAKWLAQRGADPNREDEKGMTPLHFAVKSGDAAFVRLLLEKGANREYMNDDGRKPFFYADRNNFLLNWIRRFGHNVDAMDPVTGFTALIEAAKKGDVSSAETMIDQEANVDVQCAKKNTALHYACELGNLDIITYLVGKGCALDLQNDTKCTPLLVAVRKGHNSAVKILISAGANLDTSGTDDDLNPLLAAIEAKNPEIAHDLITHGANLATRDTHGHPPITRAAQARLETTVHTLLTHGADINAQNTSTLAPLISEAAAANLPDLIDYLVAHGATLTTPDHHHNLPLQVASMNNRPLCVARLLAHGADPNTQNCFGYGSLHECADRNFADITELLLAKDADTELRVTVENGHYTPLQFASMHGHEACVRVLLAHGANLNAGNRDGWTPLAESCYHGRVAVVELLLKAGADETITCASGITPLQRAIADGRTECVELIQKYRG